MRFSSIKKLIRMALEEDAAFRDVTTQTLIPRNHRSQAVLLAKQDLVLCGMPVVREVFNRLDSRMKIQVRYSEGSLVKKGKVIARLQGKTRAILSGERVALNFLQHLSGIATLTRQFVEKTKGSRAKILDTRKTTPGLRFLEKYAVLAGGGCNHRMDLRSGAMLKDNHLAVIRSMPAALRVLRSRAPKIPVVVEVQKLRQLEAALVAGARHVLLDNMKPSQLKKAVQLARGRCRLEASGGVNLKNVRRIARTGVDFISVGALTHSAPAVDISLEILPSSS